MTQRHLPDELHRSALPAQLPELRGPWIHTYSGRAFPLLDPRAEHVHLRDIGEALAKLNRFTGHTRFPYSVAQHSLLVADLVRGWGRLDAEPYAFLHDAHEAYVGDIATPLKRALAIAGGANAGLVGGSIRSALDQIVAPIDAAIHQRFGLPWPPPGDVRDVVRHADLMALSTERRDVLIEGPASGLSWGYALPSPSAQRIDRQPWDWKDGVERFERRARRLGLTT